MSYRQRAFQRLAARARWGNWVMAEWLDTEGLKEPTRSALEALIPHLKAKPTILALQALVVAFQFGRVGKSSTVPGAFYAYAEDDPESDWQLHTVSVVLAEWDSTDGTTPTLYRDLRAVACRLVWGLAYATPDEWQPAIRQNMRYLLAAFQLGRIAALPDMPTAFSPTEAAESPGPEFWDWLDAQLPPTE